MEETPEQRDRRRVLLGTIKQIRQREMDLQTQIRLLVRVGVAEGATWAQMGEALGTTAQAAHQRYRKLCLPKIVRLKRPITYDRE